MYRRRFEMRVHERLVDAVALFDSHQRLVDALAHAISRFTGRGRERDVARIDPEPDHQAQDRDDDRSLAGAGAARDYRQAHADGRGNGVALLVGQYDLLAIDDDRPS